jgi:hypothetical protein
MIKYNLICKCNKTFESWFSSSKNYERLVKKKLINCIYCGSTLVKKTLMAPYLSSKTKQKTKDHEYGKKIKKQLVNLRRYIEKNCKDVGDNFPQEARNIYYDNKSLKGIYGKATPEETAELLDEGIEVATIPWVNKSEN